MRQLQRWDDSFSVEDTNEIVLRLSEVLLKRIKDPSIRGDLQRLLAGDDYSCIIGYNLPYLDGACHLDILYARQVLAFFQKREDLDLGIDRDAVAWSKFLEAEEHCRITNSAFRSWKLGGFRFPSRVESVFHTASRKISLILGDCPSYDDLRMRFGPGASVGLPKKNANALTKLRSPFSCSEELAPYVTNVLEQVPHWAFRDQRGDPDVASLTIEICDGKLGFVPKNAKTSRSIVTEPLLNTFVQLGIGDYMASRLKHSGQDITDQTRNQILARQGSITGELATLDLSSASDTISKEIVRHLLPFDWVELLERCRTGTIQTPTGTMKLEKFSSMGNGFTFPLETLIFLGISRAVGESLSFTRSEHETISVYGDDIIFPTRGVPLLLECLRCAGFLVNREKSCISGPFRESCGADYYKGFPVRPVYLRSQMTGQSLFVLHNFFVRDLEDELVLILKEYIGEMIYLEGPDGYGDGHLVNLDYSALPYRRKDGYGGYTFETFTLTSRCMRTLLQWGDFPFPLYQIYLSDGSGAVPEPRYKENGEIVLPLPGSRGYKRTRIYTLSK